ncbi:thioredoxin family protein [Bacillus songklensis]|uniref:Thioredoxin family protein n=1 Tax=Bacillus songklensis TaxID=1069116 RepID=A0ABV8B8Q8_9BACI
MIDWTETQLDRQLKENDRVIVFFHTPLCGTCQLAKKMLTVTEALLPDVEIGMCNLNFMPDKAEIYAIESVPCLIMIENNQVKKKIYAFHSIEYLLEELKSFSL